jgi:hypothetical protein
MDPIKAALERLDVAIDHLETALDGYAARRRAASGRSGHGKR